jgi:tetratricopeptide (TPR) repeat protein
MRATYGRLLGHIGRAEEGIKHVKQATRMSPDSLPMLYFLGANYRAAGQFDAAIKALVEHRKRLGGRIVAPPTSQLIAAYVQAGQLDKARAEVTSLIKVSPRYGVAVAQRTHIYQSEVQRTLYASALRKAGLPD